MLGLWICSWEKCFSAYSSAIAYLIEEHRSKFISLFWAFFSQRNVSRVTTAVCMQSIEILVNKLLLGQWVPNFTSELSSTPQFTPPILGITESPNKWLREKLSVSCSVFILLRRRMIFFVKTQRPGEGGAGGERMQKSSQFNHIYGLRVEMRFVKWEMWHTAVLFLFFFCKIPSSGILPNCLFSPRAQIVLW